MQRFNFNIKSFSIEPVIGTDLTTMSPTLTTKPLERQTPVVLARKAVDNIDPNYQLQVNQDNVALILYETSDVDLIWKGFLFLLHKIIIK